MERFASPAPRGRGVRAHNIRPQHPSFFKRLAASEVKGRVKIFVRDECRLQANPILEIVFERAYNLWFVDGFERIGKADTLTSKGSAMIRFLMIFITLITTFSTQNAFAGCKSTPVVFNFDANAETSSEGVITGNGFCRIVLWPNSGIINDSTIVKKPRNGKLENTNISTFEYQAKPNFKGNDDLAVKICGSGRSGGGGCATISFSFTIQ